MTCGHADPSHEESFINVWVIKFLKKSETDEGNAMLKSVRGKYEFEELEPMTIYLTSELRVHK